MAVSDELIAFVRDALGRGLTRAQIVDLLQRAGWPAEQIRGALAAYADVDSPIPVPRPKPYVSAREAFMYVVMFSALFVSAYNFGDLVFELINRAFPEPGQRAVQSAGAAIRWPVSALVVAFPLFAYMSWLIARGVRLDPTRRSSKIRRQLTYLTLFVAACTLAGDLIVVIYSFLGGELTARFVLKAATIALIGGGGFAYYLTELRADEREAEA
jgi:hypothetical protein